MLTILLIGASLSVDALTVSVANSLTLRGFCWRHALWMGAYFGAFQCLMPLAGFLLGSAVSGYVAAAAPYLSFALLAFIGAGMIRDGFRKDGAPAGMLKLSHARLLTLAVATSIDALAVGVTFALYPPAVGLLPACLLIGCVTCLLSFGGAMLGGRLSRLDPEKAGILGGVVLFAIALKILLEHLLR